ncbi:MAG TPA: patatin-like phospholipase family protein [Burkholderiaceae bacterium]|nr:patatin-like phospholipase family protein [Burkholderiaceae bacterium]
MSTEDLSEAQGVAESGRGNPTMPEFDCDLVMKGGITSGVIYPRLVAKLSKRYRFRNIGGTSAGAIAAGACAAAEFRRAMGSGQGFVSLAALPEELNDQANPTGRTKLFTLFQPAPPLRRHFAALQTALNKKPLAAVVAIAIAMLRMQWGLVALGLLIGGLLLAPLFAALDPGLGYGTCALWAVSCMVLAAFAAMQLAKSLSSAQRRPAMLWAACVLLVPALALAWASGWSLSFVRLAVSGSALIILLMVLALLLLAVAARFLLGLLTGLHANGYGCCSGKTPADGSADLPALTDWLTNYFNELAGLPAGEPLTFGHLWGTNDPKEPRRINFEVMTSAISQQMIYSIPFRDGTPTFLYDPVEWARLFPTSVMEWLDRALAANPNGDSDHGFPAGVIVQNAEGRPLKALPRRADLPVVVAVRMSLSFPILLSAVPLYSIDWSRTRNQECKVQVERQIASHEPVNSVFTATRVWFSDGGIGSNMPLQMFDSLLPSHPTFAVNLKAVHPDFGIVKPEVPDNNGGRIYLPVNNSGGGLRHWPEPRDDKAIGGLVGFVMGIVDTMQNWRDEILFPYPGFRDRIVQISQAAAEGGLNLDMPKESITALANAGEMAADRLMDRFHPAGAERGAGWRNHQTVRLRTFLGIAQPAMAGLADTLAHGPWRGYASTINAYDGAQHELADEFIVGCARLGSLEHGTKSLESGALKPVAEIRISPRI